ncbi:MAG: hypothetical protein IPK66_17110 [Rhodospirillales bacterium]|nr:hypothetical protein [Rhodospirillales bacterium]
MQALKSLVFGLGALIVVGIAVLAWGFYTKLQQTKTAGTEATANPPASPTVGVPVAAGSGFGDVRLSLPDGCSVVEMRPDRERLYVRTGPSGLCERIVIVDTANGRVLGTLLVRP